MKKRLIFKRVKKYAWCVCFILPRLAQAQELPSSVDVESMPYSPVLTEDVDYKVNMYNLYVYQQQAQRYQKLLKQLRSALQTLQALDQSEQVLETSMPHIEHKIAEYELKYQVVQEQLQHTQDYLQEHPQLDRTVALDRDTSMHLLEIYRLRKAELLAVMEPFNEKYAVLSEQFEAALNRSDVDWDADLLKRLDRQMSETYHALEPFNREFIALSKAYHALKMRFDPAYRRHSLELHQKMQEALQQLSQ